MIYGSGSTRILSSALYEFGDFEGQEKLDGAFEVQAPKSRLKALLAPYARWYLENTEFVCTEILLLL